MEYTFFNQALLERFTRLAAEMGVSTQVRSDTMEGSVVELSDDLGDELLSRLEAEYETLMDEQMVLAESEEGWVTHQAMGINIKRADGSSSSIRLHGETARRLAAQFSPEEIQELVQAIAQSIDSPVNGPICKKS